MITEIGIVAGEIWHHLDQHGEVSFAGMASALNRSRDLVLMSLGWLAREGHVIVRQQGDDMMLTLRRAS